MTLLKYIWLLLVISLLALFVQHTQLTGEKTAHQQTKAHQAEVLKDLADKTLKAYQSVVAEDTARKQAVATLDTQHTKALNEAKTQITRLQSDVAAGTRRLRIQAHCTTSTGAGLSQAPSTTGLDDAQSPRLTDSAERDYFSLRTGIETTQKQLTGLQDYVLNVCLK